MIRFVCFLLFLTNIYSSELIEGGNTKYIFPNWRNMILLNQFTFESEDHDAFVDIYVNNLAKEPYILENENFPVGSIIVKPLYPKRKREHIARLMIMMKMKNGYDTKNNDWWYGVYDKSGMNPSHEGRIISCIRCHEEARDTDYLFSESVMYKIKSQLILEDKNSIHKPFKKD